VHYKTHKIYYAPINVLPNSSQYGREGRGRGYRGDLTEKEVKFHTLVLHDRPYSRRVKVWGIWTEAHGKRNVLIAYIIMLFDH